MNEELCKRLGHEWGCGRCGETRTGINPNDFYKDFPNLKDLLSQTRLDTIKEVREKLPQEKERLILDMNHLDNYGASYAIAGFNDCLNKVKKELNNLTNQ
jgi:hypothetical protein